MKKIIGEIQTWSEPFGENLEWVKTTGSVFGEVLNNDGVPVYEKGSISYSVFSPRVADWMTVKSIIFKYKR